MLKTMVRKPVVPPPALQKLCPWQSPCNSARPKAGQVNQNQDPHLHKHKQHNLPLHLHLCRVIVEISSIQPLNITDCLNPVNRTMGCHRGLAALLGVALLLAAGQCDMNCKGIDGRPGDPGIHGRDGWPGQKGEKGEPGKSPGCTSRERDWFGDVFGGGGRCRVKIRFTSSHRQPRAMVQWIRPSCRVWRERPEVGECKEWWVPKVTAEKWDPQETLESLAPLVRWGGESSMVTVQL